MQMESARKQKAQNNMVESNIEGKTQNEKEKQKTLRNKPSKKGQGSTRYEHWEGKEIKHLFDLYQEYGSKWNLISQELSSRNQNSVKNRFYTSIRHLLKVIYRSPVSPKRFPGEIDSKYLYDFYHGRDEFKKWKNYALKFLKRMNFEEDQKVAVELWSEYELQLKDIHSTICQIKERDKKPKFMEQYVKIEEPSPDYQMDDY